MAADKKPPDNRSNQERIIDFAGGLNTTVSGSLLNKNEAQIATNISFENKGTLMPRKGRKLRFATSFSDYPVSSLGAYYKQDGTIRLLMSSYDKLFYDSPHLIFNYNEAVEFDTGVLSTRIGAAEPNFIEPDGDTLKLIPIVSDIPLCTELTDVTNERVAVFNAANRIVANEITMKVDVDSFIIRLYSPTAATYLNTTGSNFTIKMWRKKKDAVGSQEKYYDTFGSTYVVTVPVDSTFVDTTVYGKLQKDYTYMIAVTSVIADTLSHVDGVTLDTTKVTLLRSKNTIGSSSTTFPIQNFGSVGSYYGIDLLFGTTPLAAYDVALGSVNIELEHAIIETVGGVLTAEIDILDFTWQDLDDVISMWWNLDGVMITTYELPLYY